MNPPGSVRFVPLVALLGLQSAAAPTEAAPPPGAAPDPFPVRQLTDDPAQDGFPSWAPDGRSIVFSRYAEHSPERTGLHVIAPEGGEPRRLTTVLGEHPQWSPDGNYVAFDGDYGSRIQLVAATGGTPVRIVPESVAIEHGGQPKWSPDGTRIVFKSGSTLQLLDLAAGRIDAFVDLAGDRPLAACWSPDGREILATVREAENPNAAIWAFAVDGGGRRRLSPDDGASYRYPALSPDGSLIAFARCEGRACDLWIMPAGGGPRIPLATHPEYDDGPAWSPDGTRIAFVSTRGGHFDVWLAEIDLARVRAGLADAGH